MLRAVGTDVMSDEPLYAGFLGTWVLIPESCRYEQGDPPRAGIYRIAEVDGRLKFSIDWVAADGEAHQVEFDGVPDGAPVPFAGGDAVDAMSVHAVSPRDLRSSAFWKGQELMVAQRQLDESGRAMRVTQLVRFPDGTHLANVAIYRRQEHQS